jgi:hypothetical protein
MQSAPGAAPPPAPTAPAVKKADGETDAPPEDDNKFDEFMGNDAGAFANVGEYDQDDKEADVVRNPLHDSRLPCHPHANKSWSSQAARPNTALTRSMVA